MAASVDFFPFFPPPNNHNPSYPPPPPQVPSSPPPPPPHHPFQPPLPPPRPHLPPPPPAHPHPPPHVLPPPPSPAPPGHHSIVIIVVFVSLGGLFFIAFLAAALFCCIKKRKNSAQKTEFTEFDEHLKIQEVVVPGPHGEPTKVVLLEENIHIQGDIHENQKLAQSSHLHSTGEHPPHIIDMPAVQPPESGNHLIEHKA